MRITAISDTHGHHNKLNLKAGDVLVHAGDVSSIGELKQVKSFLNWFEKQPFKYKIFIAGNHDKTFDFEKDKILPLLKDRGFIYLQDSGVEIDGVKFWGSPQTPPFSWGWAFNARPEVIQAAWDMIPSNTDVLITHGPPRGVLDKVLRDGNRVGCPYLLQKVEQIKPKVHIFGHVHEGYGEFSVGGIRFYNASICGVNYKPVNRPHIIWV